MVKVAEKFATPPETEVEHGPGTAPETQPGGAPAGSRVMLARGRGPGVAPPADNIANTLYQGPALPVTRPAPAIEPFPGVKAPVTNGSEPDRPSSGTTIQRRH